MNSNGETLGFVNFADEGLELCEICLAFDIAPHIPIAGTSPVSMFGEELRANLLRLDDAIALRATEV